MDAEALVEVPVVANVLYLRARGALELLCPDRFFAHVCSLPIGRHNARRKAACKPMQAAHGK